VQAGRGFVIEKDYAEDPGRANPMYPNLPDHEAAAMRHLAGTGCAPELVSYRPPRNGAGAQVVYRYVAGTQWRSGVEDVARLLHRVHVATPPRGMRRLCRSAAEALAHADEMVADTHNVRLRRPMEAARPSLSRSERATRLSLVHTDCGPGNIVRSRRGVVLIDWQCPGLGDPAEDVFSFLSPAFQILFEREPLSAVDRRGFLDAYDDPATEDRLDRLWPSLTYRMAAYCAVRAAALDRPTDVDARRRYERAIDVSLTELERP